jgi:hypothetical protein
MLDFLNPSSALYAVDGGLWDISVVHKSQQSDDAATTANEQSLACTLDDRGIAWFTENELVRCDGRKNERSSRLAFADRVDGELEGARGQQFAAYPQLSFSRNLSSVRNVAPKSFRNVTSSEISKS